MRLFVSILPPDGALAELAAATEPLRLAAPELRWTSRASWHMTVAFLGDVADDKLPGLRTRLERAARRHHEQQLAIAGGGAFPSARRARIVWAGLQGDSRALGRLAASVAAGARRAGAPPPDEGKKYHPHLTLARCPVQTDASGLTSELARFSGTAWTAAEIHLMRSRPGDGRPRYDSIGAWPLAASAARARQRPG